MRGLGEGVEVQDRAQRTNKLVAGVEFEKSQTRPTATFFIFNSSKNEKQGVEGRKVGHVSVKGGGEEKEK